MKAPVERWLFSWMALARSSYPVVWIAGILGAFYVAAVIILAPKLGTALTFSLAVAEQMVVSVVLLSLPGARRAGWTSDRFEIFGELSSASIFSKANLAPVDKDFFAVPFRPEPGGATTTYSSWTNT